MKCASCNNTARYGQTQCGRCAEQDEQALRKEEVFARLDMTIGDISEGPLREFAEAARDAIFELAGRRW